MNLFLSALASLVAAAALSRLLVRFPRVASAAGVAGPLAAAVLALPPAVRALTAATPASLSCGWPLPGLHISLALDPLAAVFLIPALLVAAVAAVYGRAYLGAGDRDAAGSWWAYNLLTASLLILPVAQNALLFLAAWEAMSILSFLLVIHEHHDAEVREAGWVYVLASHAGTVLLLGGFCLLARAAGSLDFDAIARKPPAAAAGAVALGLSLVGFGTKAGLVPLHVWLPRAHPAAPSHVSALMSGVLIKTGFLGLLRVGLLVGGGGAGWGWVLLAAGVGSGLLGVVFALVQGDLKRVLAYSSVENVGIISLGLGVGFVGAAHGADTLAALAVGGALFHLLSHGLFKALLFMVAGAIKRGAGSLDLNVLGGLIKRMPWTGAAFVAGGACAAGLPPLTGFAGEFLIYVGCFTGGLAGGAAPEGLAATVAIGALALIGGLAAACFARAVGTAMLGEPRQPLTATEQPLAMRAAMALLAAGCLAAGLAAGWLVPLLTAAVAQLTRLPTTTVQPLLAGAGGWLKAVSMAGGATLAAAVALAALRALLLRRRVRGTAGTWDCGYAAPAASMQYTASSFAQPLVDTLGAAAAAPTVVERPQGLFPVRAAVTVSSPDLFERALFRPLFVAAARALNVARAVQHGRVHAYVVVVVAVLLGLLLWEL